MPSPTARRFRTPTFPLVGGHFDGLRDCPTSLAVHPALPEVVGEAAGAITIDLRMQCPQHLAARTAVVVTGALGEAALPNVRAGLTSLIDGLAGGGRSHVAFVDATAAPAAIAALAVDTNRAAVDAAIASWSARAAGTSERWQANIRAATAHLLRLRPTQAPMLVVVDGSPPAGDAAAAVDALIAGLRPLHDAVGLVLVFDLSKDSWLADAARFGGGDPRSMIYAQDGEPEAGDIVQSMAAAMGMLGGPITQSNVSVDVPATLAVVPGSIRPRPIAPDWPMWRDPHDERRLIMRIEAQLRMAPGAAEGRHPLNLSVNTWRDGFAPSAQDFTFDVCTHAAGSTAVCVPTPTVTPTSTATRRSTATRASPVTSTAPPTRSTLVPPETALPTAARAQRVWLPLAIRLSQ